jgi:DNA topoisomerase I
MPNKKKYIKIIKGNKKTCKMVEKCTTIKKKSKKKSSKRNSKKSKKGSQKNKNKNNNNSVKFKYVLNNSNKNKVVTNNKILNRINNLRIPPAYKDVKISNDEDSYLQAVGVDDKGRKQYIYHPKFIKEKEEEKYNNVILLGKKMKEIKRDLKNKIKKMANQNYKDMKQPESNINIILNLLVNNNFRIGSKKYADKYKSYGASTLKNKHLNFIPTHKLMNNNNNLNDNQLNTDFNNLDKIRYQKDSNLNNNNNNNNSNSNNYNKNNNNFKILQVKFVGKKGVINEDIINDPNMINILSKIKNNQKQHLFMYPTHDGTNHLVSNEQISHALQKYHPDLTPKMIRTWRANTHLLEKLKKDHKEKNSELGKLYNKEKNKYIKMCCDHVSNKLHNTPAITKKSYLDNLLIKKIENEPKKIMKIIHNESNKRLTEDELLVQLLKKIGRKVL